MKQHIQDLECTLKINKEMLSTILLDTLGSEKDKAIVGNLNKENR